MDRGNAPSYADDLDMMKTGRPLFGIMTNPPPTGPVRKLDGQDHGSRNATRAETGPRAGVF
ncbi:30S ribosomal protein S4 [Nitrobacter sp. Nb-311A]|nr:30S ribosomal protein S4 [Nitrobacter sp. Nb-311A]